MWEKNKWIRIVPAGSLRPQHLIYITSDVRSRGTLWAHFIRIRWHRNNNNARGNEVSPPGECYWIPRVVGQLCALMALFTATMFPTARPPRPARSSLSKHDIISMIEVGTLKWLICVQSEMTLRQHWPTFTEWHSPMILICGTAV